MEPVRSLAHKAIPIHLPDAEGNLRPYKAVSYKCSSSGEGRLIFEDLVLEPCDPVPEDLEPGTARLVQQAKQTLQDGRQLLVQSTLLLEGVHISQSRHVEIVRDRSGKVLEFVPGPAGDTTITAADVGDGGVLTWIDGVFQKDLAATEALVGTESEEG